MQKYLFVLAGFAIGLTITFAAVAHASPTICQIFNGCTGTSTTPTYGQILVGGKSGEYEFVATSTLGGGTGTVTSVATNNGILGGTITTTGTLSLDQAFGAIWTAASSTYTNHLSLNTASSTLFGTGTLWLPNITKSLLATDANGLVVASSTIGNAQLANNSITVTTASPLGGAATVPLGGTLALTCTGCLNSNAGDWAGTWQTFSPSHFQVAGSYLTASPIATSTGETTGQLAYWTSTNGTPATLGKVATSTLTPSSPLTGSFVQIGSGGSIGCQTASGSQAGCLSSADWTTFNGKQATISATWPILFLANTVSWGGLSTTTNLTTGQLVYASGAGSITSVATSTLSASPPLTGSFIQIGSSGSLGIQAASGSQNGYLSSVDYSLLHTATTTFSSPLSYSVGTNAVTCPTCQTSAAAWPWNTLTNYGTTTDATTTPSWFQMGLYASSTSQFVNATTSQLTTGTFWDTNITSALSLFDANHKETAYAGSTPCTNQVALSLSATGVITCTSVTNATLSNSTISGIALGSNLNSLSPNSTLNGSSYNGSAAVNNWGLNLGNSNWWTATQNFTQASTSMFTATSTVWFTALTNAPLGVDSNGKVISAGTGSSGNCVKWGANNTLADQGSACGSGSSAWPFTTGNTNFAVAVQSTTTPEWFQNGVFASSTSQFVNLNAWGVLTVTGTGTSTIANENTEYWVPPNFNTAGCAGDATKTDFGACVNALYALAANSGQYAVSIKVPNIKVAAANWTTAINFNTNGLIASFQCVTGATLIYGGTGTSTIFNMSNPTGHLTSDDYGCSYQGSNTLIAAAQTNTKTTVGIGFGGSNGAVGVNFHDNSVNGFGQDIEIGANAYMLSFHNNAISGGNGSTTAAFGSLVTIDKANNSGERNVFDGNSFTDPGNSIATSSIYISDVGTASNFFTNNSFDDVQVYCGGSDGMCSFDNNHWENSAHAIYGMYIPVLGKTASQSTQISFTNNEIANDGSGGDTFQMIIRHGGHLFASGNHIDNYNGGTVTTFADHRLNDGASSEIVCQTEIQGGALTNIVANQAYSLAAGPACWEDYANSYPIGMLQNSNNTADIRNGNANAATFDNNGNWTFLGTASIGTRLAFNGTPVAFANPISIGGANPPAFMYLDSTYSQFRIGTQGATGYNNISFELPSGSGYQDALVLTPTLVAPATAFDNLLSLGTTSQRWESLRIGTGQVIFDSLGAGAVSSSASGLLSSGTLSIANGGTATTTLGVTNGVVYNNGTNWTNGSVATFDGTTLTSSLLAASQGSGTSTIASGQGFTIGGTQFVLQQGSGRVGIGTNAPTQKLQVNGSQYDSGGDFFLDTGHAFQWGDGSVYLTGDTNAHNFQFITNSAEHMRLDTNGNLGIGTTTPQWNATISTAGSIKPQLAITDGVSGTNAWTFRNSSSTLMIATSTYSATSSKSAMIIDQNGKVYFPETTVQAGAATDYWCYDANQQLIRVSAICTTSARRFKKDIAPLNVGLADLMKLQPVQYLRKDPLDVMDSHEQMGFIADDVASSSVALNEMLVTYVGGGTSGVVQGFRYDQFTALLTKSIQDLYGIVQGVISHQTTQDARITALEAEVANLKKGQIQNMCPIN